MANDQFVLKEDGFIKIGTQSSTITYHSSLNVILVFNRENEVKVLDVHSSVILKSCKLSEGKHRVRGRYLPLQEKILLWDDRNLALRGDYNGVLLLDTILQTPVPQNDDIVRLEMLLSEAILFLQSLQSLEDHGVECPSDVSNELSEKIKEAQSNVKKSIKAQRWNTVCIELPYSSLKLVANNVVFNLKQTERHIPALAIASAINERLTDLLVGSRVRDTVNSGTFERCLMYSEAARRQTFEKWPHMDYKWALPDQMAQAGFYHQPSSTGEDRAMCFTCNVCLVCWEKTDEPWSEHERHSPNCPFVKGEYTQNVPLSVTYATSPAVRTEGFNVISNTDHSHVLITSNYNGEVTIWNVERQLKKMHSFQMQNFLKDILNGEDKICSIQVTAIGVLPMYSSSESSQNAFISKTSVSPKVNVLGSKFVVGVAVGGSSGEQQLYLTAFVIEESENRKESIPNAESMVKVDFPMKTELEKEPSLSKLVSEENFDSGLLKLKLGQVCPWKVNEDEKSFYLDFDHNSTQVGIACKIIEDTEKALKEYDAAKVENLESAKNQAFISTIKTDEVSCRMISCINIAPPSDDGFTITDVTSVNEGRNVLVKLQRSDSILIDIEDETLKMEVDEDATTIPSSFNVNSQLQVFAINEYGVIDDLPLNSREFDNDKTAREICVIPKLDGGSVVPSGTSETASSVVCLVCMDGTLELIQLNSLNTTAKKLSLQNEKIVSATYCKSLERLCACAENGSLIFYALRDNDSESTDEMMDEDNALFITSDASLTGCDQEVSEIDGGSSASPKNAKKQAEQLQTNLPSCNLIGATGDSAHSSPTPSLLAYKNDITAADLQSLYSLTLFDEMLTPYVAEVPGCWNELVQAQKQRRHPQHLRPGDDTHLMKTWRLHNDATTWDEHIIELTLVKPSCLGHIDLKFSLYQQCPNPPAIQVTLLKQNTSGFGYRMKSHHTINVGNDSAVDENIEFSLNDNEGTNENPVLTEEYLQAHNAEILAGPIELSSCMDLCDQGGLVTLTSPKLFKTRARNFLLHIKTMVDPSKDGQGKTRVPVRKKGVMRFLFSSFANNSSQNSTNATYSQNSSNKQSRNDYYIGCDWLHEISITVRSTKSDNKIINDRVQRIAMLESNSFLENLLKLSCDTSKLQQNIALDILQWVCTIRLTRFRSPKIMERGGGGSCKARTHESSQKVAAGLSGFNENSNMDMTAQQKECVEIIEQHLKKLIMSCIINGDRTLAHKAVKLILIVSEGVRNLPNEVHQKYSFDASLRIAIVSCLPFIATTKFSSAVRWFTFLISATSSPESHVAISESCVKLLMKITGEINKRWNLFDSLLGSRYGLYGFPFEPDKFDMDLPALTRGNSTPNTLANIIKSNAGLMQPGGLDIKKLSSIDGVELRSFPHLIKRKGISNQVRGLFEVEPLHFTCLAASEATRIENTDSLTSSTASNINMEEIMTSTPLYNNVDGFFDAKKDADKDNINDDMMNNVKNLLGDKFVNSALKKYKLNGVVEPTESYPINCDKMQKIKPKTSAQYQEPEEYNPSDEPNSEAKLANKIKKYIAEGACNEDYTNIFSWHKLLSLPPKQMVVVDRIHSGARRYVIIDFGSPILLTDLVIPACDELASLFIDIWCLDEDTDSTRLVATQDIGTKTLVLSDLQPPPICRYMKITIIGRYGMSATRCKIPIGYFYGHVIILENEAYADPLLNYVKANPANITGQVKALKSLYEDVHCRYSLSSSKLIELLTPILNSELCNVAHMHAYINKLKDDDNQIDNAKIVSIYDECISLQHQLNIIRNVIDRLESALDPQKNPTHSQNLASASRDKLRTLSESLIEILLHFTIEYGTNNVLSLHSFFNMDVANILFNTLVVSGDAHIQLATCSLLVRMCCFQSWWGDFLANIFCTLYSSQNTRIFPQDRVFFLLSYLGRKSIMMGTCRSIVIDAILKTLAKLLAPISPRYTRNENLREGGTSQTTSTSLWSKSDLQLITWLLLFLSVCLDGSNEKKDKSSNRWEFMSCDSDLSKSRPQTSSNSGKSMPRCFKKRIIQQNKYNGIQSYTDWSKKIYMLQSELPEIFMELTGKSKPKITKPSITPKPPKEPPAETENSFDQGLKSTKVANLLIVIRGLIGLILEMDFTCNMDLFLLTCKVIARLVSACKPSIQLSKVITAHQLEQLIRLAVWNDQQQPWAVHTITCLLQDLLDADKNFKEPFEDDNDNNEGNMMEGLVDIEAIAAEISESPQGLMHSQVVKDISYADTVKYGQLPSLIECEDAELDEFLHDFDIVERGKNLMKKDNLWQNKNSFNFFCKSVSSSLDARLDYGLDTNVEILIRRLTMTPSLDLYDSLPQISTNEMDYSSSELLAWPESITLAWSGPEYNSGQQACEVFKNVFDNIFADLHLQDTWVHLEQLLQMWLTLNSELSERPGIRRIAFGTNAVQGLLSALAWHSDIKLRTWGLGFHCLTLACHLKPDCDGDNSNYNSRHIDVAIIKDENFEKMLLRFFSGYGMTSSTTTNRCAGPTICKYLHQLLGVLSINANFADPSTNVKRKLKDTLLNVVLQLVQPGGAISNQQGPIDAQSQLVRDLMSIHYDKADLNVAMSIIESVSFLVYNNISNSEKILCQRSSDSGSTNNTFGSLFATVLGSDNSKQNTTVSDSSLIVSLLKLSASLVQTEIESRAEDVTRSGGEMSTESQTDEIKAEQQSSIEIKTKVPCVADTVLRHFPTMKRLLGSLSHCNSSSFSLFVSSSLYQINITEISSSLNEPQTTADAVFHLLMLLCTKASQTNLVIAPIYQYLESNSSPRNILPRLQLSEPFLWYVLKVLETPAAVAVFSEMGGMKILCQNLIKCNKVLMNMQPGLISLIMQHLTKSSKIRCIANNNASSSCARKSQSNTKASDGAINFAPFCVISSESSTAQPADVLIQTPIASHRRARTPAWSYMFYPNESYVDLTLTLPTAIMLMEIQIQPHLSSLASCPSAVAVEISRDCGLGPIPFGQAHTTVGMTFIRLKLAKPEIASSIVLRLYRPKDSSSIGLTQISVLGTTIFNGGKCVASSNEMPVMEDDSFAKTGVGWIRILARCFSVAMFVPDSPLTESVVTAAAEYPGFLEACCTLLNIMPLCSNIALQNLETVLLKLGTHSRALSLSLVHNLLSGTMPQVYRLCNEAVCDLLYDLCTKNDTFSTDRIYVLLEWIIKTYANFDTRSMQQINPQSGLLKVISSILWTVHKDRTVANLVEMTNDQLFDVCFRMVENSETNAALRTAFDSLICSFCYIRPELFSKLLTNCGFVEHIRMEGMTDDSKEANSSSSLAAGQTNDENISKLLDNISLLSTLSIACQSRQAVQCLIESKLPRRLAQAIHEFCCSISPEVRKISSKNRKISNCSLTDSDKAENVKIDEMSENSALRVNQLPEVLDFFSECCAEGHMRDWLGSYQGSIFWKPLLELLCNHRPTNSSTEPLQQQFIRIERSTINFFSRVTACHPKNQENLTFILISVIKKPQKLISPSSTTIISGFTRRLVLQLLLESEKILVSVRSKMTLQKRNNSIYLVNSHPSKRTSAHHLLFYLSSHTKCQELLQNCISIYSNILPSISSDPKQSEAGGSNTAGKTQNDNHKELLDMGIRIGAQGMELLSVVAGVTAKDKRLKDVKNQAAALKEKDLYPKYAKLASDDFFAANLRNQVSNCAANCLQFQHPACPDVILTSDTTISQILALLHSRGHSLSTPCLQLELISNAIQTDEFIDESVIKASNFEPLPTPLQRFSSRGGLSLLAHYLPTVFPENSKTNASHPDKEKTPPSSDWVKVEPNDEIYEDLEDTTTESSSKIPAITSVPQHSLAAFGLFLRLPAYSDVLLRDKLRAQCLLRLVLGVTGDGEGNDIYSLSLAPSLPTLPFEVFRQLLDGSPLTTDDGVLLRRMVIEVGAMHLVLNCLGIFTHQSQNYQIGAQVEIANGVKTPATDQDQVISDDKSHVYWAKGTGFGTGSTQQSWDVEQALLRQKSEEEHVTVLLQVLSSYINPGDKVPKYLSCDEVMIYHEITEVAGELPTIFQDLLQQSCLIPALSSYLRNDSVLDITRHIPLYRAILQLLRALALCNQLMGLLQPKDSNEESTSIASLLTNMKTCVDTYAKRLKVNKKSNIKGQTQKVTINIDDGDDEGLALLIPDIQETTLLVQRASNMDSQSNCSQDTEKGYVDRPISNSIEQRYLEVMKKLQFDTYEMIVECENGYRFVVSHHFENNVRTAGDRGHPSRVKRLAQETVTLSTSLPLSYSSSVFVRCDTDRLDIMKVLITGPADTPYANGCFEFDVYFPPDYPNSPMLINLETTGRHTVRFNPNLYNDGKVCLSVLNTWHGRPEEKWNAQTSSFLQVLVSIQSLILVPEPYFNEPGFERSRGTPSGTHCSREYNSNIYQACVRWAMLEQIRNPSPCFKEVIHTHFWLKRNEICAQIENWIIELNKPQYTERSGRAISFNSMVLRRQYKQLREELAKLSVPEGLEDLDTPFNPTATCLLAMPEAITQQSPTQSAAQPPANLSSSTGATDTDIAATTPSVSDVASSSVAMQEDTMSSQNQIENDQLKNAVQCQLHRR